MLGCACPGGQRSRADERRDGVARIEVDTSLEEPVNTADLRLVAQHLTTRPTQDLDFFTRVVRQ